MSDYELVFLNEPDYPCGNPKPYARLCISVYSQKRNLSASIFIDDTRFIIKEDGRFVINSNLHGIEQIQDSIAALIYKINSAESELFE